jgi:serine/threonine protein phosphatase 1
MPRIHALSDIHGHADQFKRLIDAIDLDGHPDTSLVLLGDYIDRGPDSAKCLYLAKELSDRHPKRVTVLLGNHETDFLDWLDGGAEAVDWLLADHDLGTIRSFVNDNDLLTVSEQLADTRDFDVAAASNGFVQGLIRAEHHELLTWLRTRPLYHETAEQIYVHAGIDEEAGKEWKAHTPDHVFVQKFPAQFGPFYKTIICGHTGTGGMHGNGSHAPYFDGQAHWYIDGSVEKTGKLNVLAYDTDTADYSYFNGPARNYVLVDQGLVVPEAYTVHIDGEEIGYMRVRAGTARAEYNGTTIWEHGEDADRSSDASYFQLVERELIATTLLHEALQAIDTAYCAEHPDAPTHDLWPVGFELIPYDHSED